MSWLASPPLLSRLRLPPHPPRQQVPHEVEGAGSCLEKSILLVRDVRTQSTHTLPIQKCSDDGQLTQVQ